MLGVIVHILSYFPFVILRSPMTLFRNWVGVFWSVSLEHSVEHIPFDLWRVCFIWCASIFMIRMITFWVWNDHNIRIFFFKMINYVFVVAKFAPSSLKCSVYGEVSRYIIIHFVLVRISEFQLMNACLDFQQNIFNFFLTNFNSSHSNNK